MCIMTNIVIFDRHFLRKSEIDSNNYNINFHKDSKTGLRLGSLVTFDPNFDPLEMRNEKKRKVISFATFLRGIQICNQNLILTTLKSRPVGDHILTPWPLTLCNLHFPSIFWQNKHIALKLRDSSWVYFLCLFFVFSFVFFFCTAIFFKNQLCNYHFFFFQDSRKRDCLYTNDPKH